MELDGAGLRRAAAKSKDAVASRRMLALALVLDGYNRTDAAEQCGMDRQTLRDWVHHYNAFGLPGLADRVPPDSKPRLSPEQEAEVAKWVREGPTLCQHGVVRWRRIDLSRKIKARFDVPRHPGHDAAAQEAHTKTLPTWVPPRSRSKPIELWWHDEARIGQPRTLTRLRAKGAAVLQRPATAATVGVATLQPPELNPQENIW